MAKPILNVVDIRTLIEKYSSELRLLDFQTSAIKSNIKELEEMLNHDSGSTEKKSGKAGRPAKSQAPTAANYSSDEVIEQPVKRGPGRPRLIPLDEIRVDPNLPSLPKKPKAPKAEKAPKKEKAEKGKKGRKPGFNRWEDAILTMLRESQQPLKNEDLMAAMQLVADRDNIQEGKAQLKVRLNQALVKLGNKLQLLKKESFPGKGFMYSLK